MTRILVAYASKHGSTEEVARAIASTLRRAGSHVDVLAAAEAPRPDEYDAVVLGGSIYMGRWHRDARRFLDAHFDDLVQRPIAVFALGPISMDKEASSHAQLERALGAVGIEPDTVAIFGAVIDPDALHFPFNRMPKTDERDWSAIERWALEVLELVERGRVPVS